MVIAVTVQQALMGVFVNTTLMTVARTHVVTIKIVKMV